MLRIGFSFLLLALAAFGQYTAAPGGAPPAGLASSVAALLEKQGTKILSGGAPLLEIWLRDSLPSGAQSAEPNVTLPSVPHGALVGVVRVDAAYADRRAQTIKPGLYTMRFSYFPENGDHQGVAPQRDFLLLVPAAADDDGAATPDFDKLMTMSRKASGTPHPAVYSFWKEDPAAFKAGVSKSGEHDWVLMKKIGDVPVTIIIIGKAES